VPPIGSLLQKIPQTRVSLPWFVPKSRRDGDTALSASADFKDYEFNSTAESNMMSP